MSKRPYVSAKRLQANSQAAMLAAIEMYNKPSVQYRDEIVTILIVNAWELIIKASLCKHRKSIYYPKKRGEDYKTISFRESLARMKKHDLWPTDIDSRAICANIEAIAKYRNEVIHLYPAQDLGGILHGFLQQNITNYRDFAVSVFEKDLAEEITWQLLPLSAKAPSEIVRSLAVGGCKQSSHAVRNFFWMTYEEF